MRSHPYLRDWCRVLHGRAYREPSACLKSAVAPGSVLRLRANPWPDRWARALPLLLPELQWALVSRPGFAARKARAHFEPITIPRAPSSRRRQASRQSRWSKPNYRSNRLLLHPSPDWSSIPDRHWRRALPRAAHYRRSRGGALRVVQYGCLQAPCVIRRWSRGAGARATAPAAAIRPLSLPAGDRTCGCRSARAARYWEARNRRQIGARENSTFACASWAWIPEPAVCWRGA